MNKKKICIFSAMYLPNSGGVERYTYNLAKNLVAMGAEVTVITSDTHGLGVYEKTEGFSIYRLPCYNFMSGRYPVVKWNSSMKKILQKYQKQYDLVVVNTRFYTLSCIGAKFGKKHGKKCIIIEHGTSHMSVHNALFDLGEKIVEHSLTALVKSRCKHYYGVSEACNQWLKHFHIKAAGVLYNAIDIEQIEGIMRASERDFRGEHGIPKTAKIIAFTGRMLQEKGVIELEEAFMKISREFPDAYLVYAGDGPLYETIRQNKHKNLICLGLVSFEQVVSMLKATDIFCLPSVSEGMPTSVLEAIACRNFIITTEKGGAKEIILNEQYGIIIENNQVEKIVEALRKALSNNEYRENAIQMSFERLTNNFTWKNTAQRILDIAAGK